MDHGVGRDDRTVQVLGDVGAGRVAVGAHQGLHRDPAGHLTALHAAHAVRHREQQAAALAFLRIVREPAAVAVLRCSCA